MKLDNLKIKNKLKIKDIDNLEIAQFFIKGYILSRQGLKKLGILRSERNLQSDYAEWLVSKLLVLKLESNKVQKGYDAIDAKGIKYQIKSRIVENMNKNTSFDLHNIDQKFDYLVCVFFSYEFDILGIIRTSYEVANELGKQTKSTFRFRWNNKIANDSRIEKLYWLKEKIKNEN
jgi:hypothetical protein